MLRCGAPFFCAGPVRYVNTCVHAKFEANLCTWAPSRTVDVSRFRVGRRAATAGGGRAVAARPPPLGGGDRRRPPPVAEAAEADRACVVCMHRPQSHIALPCGHLIYCGGCATLMRGKPCALCMHEVSEIKEVFRG